MTQLFFLEEETAALPVFEKEQASVVVKFFDNFHEVLDFSDFFAVKYKRQTAVNSLDLSELQSYSVAIRKELKITGVLRIERCTMFCGNPVTIETLFFDR